MSQIQMKDLFLHNANLDLYVKQELSKEKFKLNFKITDNADLRNMVVPQELYGIALELDVDIKSLVENIIYIFTLQITEGVSEEQKHIIKLLRDYKEIDKTEKNKLLKYILTNLKGINL